MLTYSLSKDHSGKIDRFEETVGRFVRGEISKAEFKPHHVIMGVYEQRTPGSYMLRVRNAGGIVTPHQLAGIAAIAKLYGNGALHITTRQEIQLHDLAVESLAPAMRALAELSLSSYAGGGNTLRNITAGFDSGVQPGELFDVEPYHLSLTQYLVEDPGSVGLPRKFKISFSGSSEDKGFATLHDVGFIASYKNNINGFKVFVAGGLGGNSSAGKLLFDFVEADETFPIAVAVRNVFSKYGNRENRARARLRFLWDTLGEERFRELFNEEYIAVKASLALPTIYPIENGVANDVAHENIDDAFIFNTWQGRYAHRQKQDGYFTILIPVILGDLGGEAAERLSRFAAQFSENTIRFSTDQNIWLRNIPEKNLSNAYNFIIENFPASRSSLYAGIVACTGAATCQLGLCLSRNAAHEIFRKLEASGLDLDAARDARIRISGCPNSCGQHWNADMGFYGLSRKNGAHSYPAYQVVLGGRHDSSGAHLAQKSKIIPAAVIGDFVTDVLHDYVENYGSMIFEEYVARHAAAFIDDIINRKYAAVPDFDEDPRYYFDLGSDRPYGH